MDSATDLWPTVQRCHNMSVNVFTVHCKEHFFILNYGIWWQSMVAVVTQQLLSFLDEQK